MNTDLAYVYAPKYLVLRYEYLKFSTHAAYHLSVDPQIYTLCKIFTSPDDNGGDRKEIPKYVHIEYNECGIGDIVGPPIIFDVSNNVNIALVTDNFDEVITFNSMMVL